MAGEHDEELDAEISGVVESFPALFLQDYASSSSSSRSKQRPNEDHEIGDISLNHHQEPPRLLTYSINLVIGSHRLTRDIYL